MDPEIQQLEHVNNAITECMDKDEQQWDYYEQLQSSQNGIYYYSNKYSRKLLSLLSLLSFVT